MTEEVHEPAELTLPAVDVLGDARQALAERLVEEARSSGLNLIGPGGLLADIAKRVIEAGLEVEMTEHLGYERHAVEGRGSGNSRNGYTPKTVTTDIGDVELAVPRDRAGTFDPATVPKHQRRLEGLSANVISLYAKGMTTGDIQAHLEEIYGTTVSRETISKITDEVLESEGRALSIADVLIDAISCRPVTLFTGEVQPGADAGRKHLRGGLGRQRRGIPVVLDHRLTP